MEAYLAGTTGLLAGVLKDELGVIVPVADLSTMLITLIDIQTNTVINSRNSQNALNANNVTIDSSGNLQWTLQPLDNIIVTSTKPIERHRVMFSWTYAPAGTKVGRHIEDFDVQNV